MNLTENRAGPGLGPRLRSPFEGSADQIAQLRQGAESLVNTYPFLSVALAFGCGVFLGWLIKRR